MRPREGSERGAKTKIAFNRRRLRAGLTGEGNMMKLTLAVATAALGVTAIATAQVSFFMFPLLCGPAHAAECSQAGVSKRCCLLIAASLPRGAWLGPSLCRQ